MPEPLPHIAKLKPYVPGLQPTDSGWIKLNTNENPYPPSPAVNEALQAVLDGAGERLRFYPEPSSASLRAAIAAANEIDTACVICGNGSDDILNLLMRAYAGGASRAAVALPTYSLYSVLAAIQGAELVSVRCDNDISIDIDALLGLEASLYFITSPNAPTGVAVPNETLAELLEKTDALVVVDEAYSAFADETASALLGRFDNLVITRTFSKSHGLAGLRVGYALAQSAVIEVLDAVRDSYNLDCLAQAGAMAAIQDEAYYNEITERIKATRQQLMTSLRARGWFLYPSQANFVFVRPCDKSGQSGRDIAADLARFLESRKILIRYFPTDPLACDFLRISIGLDADMKILNQAIDEWQKNV